MSSVDEEQEHSFQENNLFVSKYDFIKVIGKGSFGVVVSAMTKFGTPREVAVKIIKKKSISEENLGFLRNEAEILRTLNHRNIVNFHSVFLLDFIFKKR